MATAPAEAGTHIPGENIPDGPLDYEAEARKLGWSPLDEFKGDPKHHLDAETFYTRSVEFMPIAKATIRKLTQRLDAAERTAKQASEFFSKAEERAYQRALDDIRAEQEAAVEAGDIEAHRRAADKLDKLEKPGTANDAPPMDAESAAEAFADWGRANKWYANDPILRAYADSQAEILLKSGVAPGPDHLAKVTEKVKAKFPEEFEEDAAPAPRQKRSPVDGGGQRPGSRGGKTAADLPDGGAQMRRFIKAGYVKSEADYLKSYQW